MKTLPNISLLASLLILASVGLPGHTIRRETLAPAELVGKWGKPSGQTWEFRTDNTYTVSLGNGKTSVSGQYTISEDQFTLVDGSATGMAQACTSGQKGVYKFTVNDKTLTVIKVSDPCEGRGNIAPGSYTRK